MEEIRGKNRQGGTVRVFMAGRDGAYQEFIERGVFVNVSHHSRDKCIRSRMSPCGHIWQRLVLVSVAVVVSTDPYVTIVSIAMQMLVKILLQCICQCKLFSAGYFLSHLHSCFNSHQKPPHTEFVLRLYIPESNQSQKLLSGCRLPFASHAMFYPCTFRNALNYIV